MTRIVVAVVVSLWSVSLWAAPSPQEGEAAQSRETAVISGRVVDAADGSPLARAVIQPSDAPPVVAETGAFELAVGAGTVILEITARGYAPARVELTLVGGETREVVVELRRASVDERVRVVAAPEPGGAGGREVDSEQVLRVAGALDNVFRVLQTLPGVAAPEDFSGRLSVRGGGPDQNLTVLDGVEVHNPYRLFGLVSAFNPETVDRFELTAGGFGADRGDRLSSLLVVDSRAGAGRFAGSASMSVTDANFVLEGGWGRGRRWLASGRRTYYDLVAERISDSQFPAFGDLQLRLDVPMATGWLVGTALRSREDADLSIEDEIEGDRAAAITAAENDVYALRWTMAPRSDVVARTTVSRYRNVEAIDFDGSFRAELRRANVPGNEAFGRLDVVFAREIGVRDTGLRQEVEFGIGDHGRLDVGLELHDLESATRFVTSGDRNPQAANGSSVRGGAGLPDELESSLAGTRGGVWGQTVLGIGSRLTVTPGVRYDWSTTNGDATVSPRLAASLVLGERDSLTFGGGLYTQSPGYEKLLQSDTFLDLSAARSSGLRHQRAWHAIVGYRRELGGGFSLEAEAWHKRFDDLVIGALESAAERAARIATYEFPEALRDQIPSGAIITSRPTNDGAGTARGLDLFLVRRPRAARDLFGWIAYSLGRAEQEAYGRRFPFDYDRRHSVALVAGWRPAARWELGGTYRWASGFPRTGPLGVRVDAVPIENDSAILVPAIDDAGNPIWIVDYGDVRNLNASRLPSYSRLDLRVGYLPGGAAGRWQVYLEVLNVLGRENAGSMEPALLYDPASDRPRIVESPDGALPRLPSFGVRFRF